jgi:creatinine amidohydrolase
MIDKSDFPEIYFNEMTSTDLAEAGTAVENWVAVLPIAATEQHGPHLPLGTDSLINEGLIQRFAEGKAADYPVTFLPAQQIGKSDEHMAFPGTLTLTGETARSSWVQIGEALATSGIRRLILLNSHGGNSAVMEQVALDLRHSHILCVATSWSRLGDASGIFNQNERDYGIHAGDIETSLMLALRPDLVRMEAAESFGSEQAEFAADNHLLRAYGRHSFGWRMEDLNRYGAVGDASAATAEKGEQLIATALDGFEALLQDVMKFDLERFV